MGIIARQVNKHRNQNLAAARLYRATRSPGEVLDALRAFTEDTNAELRAAILSKKKTRLGQWALGDGPRAVTKYYDVVNQDTNAHIAFGWSAAKILAGDKAWRTNGAWLARLTTTQTDDGTELAITLLAWTIDGENARMKNLDRYEQLIADLVARLQAAPVAMPEAIRHD